VKKVHFVAFLACSGVAVVLAELAEAEAADRRAQLMTAASHWHVLRIGPEIVERAISASLPDDPALETTSRRGRSPVWTATPTEPSAERT
jgi:hypothetical protein